MTSKNKNTVQFILAWVAIFIGVGLIFLSFLVPPMGEIHPSVLTAFGEILTFAGTVIGIDYSYKKKVLQKNNKQDE